MEQTLKAAVREGTGKGVSRQLRAQNRVPAVLYGAGVEPMGLHVDARDLFHVLHTDAGQNVLIDLQVEGDKSHLALARELQQDHIKGRMIHVDFLAIRADQTITVMVPVEISGSAAGIIEGGVMEHHMWEVELECLPTDVPDQITVDITSLGIGDSLHVSDIVPPEGTSITSDPEEMVVAVVQPQLAVEVEEVAELGEAGAEAGEGAEGEGSSEESSES